MENSILNTIKKLIGIDVEITDFDLDLITHINSVFFILYQLGVGPDTPFSITGADSVWSDFTNDIAKIELVKTYVSAKVRLMFDPPQSSGALESLTKLVAEYEWRLNVETDHG